jgi:hypothetical protein
MNRKVFPAGSRPPATIPAKKTVGCIGVPKVRQ